MESATVGDIINKDISFMEDDRQASKDSQKCYLHTDVMKFLKCDINQFVNIHIGSLSHICSVWPLGDEFDSSLIKYTKTVNKVEITETKDNICRLEPVVCKKADSISVSIIVRDYNKYKSWNSSNRTLKDLETKCVRCLRNICVKSGYSVALKSQKLAKLYGISFILINSTNSGETCDAVIVHPKVKIHIDRVQSEDRFKLILKSPPSVLGGIKYIEDQLSDLICLPLNHSDQMRVLNLVRAQGILLRGPPGCGKTSLVKSLAFKCQAALITINGPEVLGSRPGETEEQIRTIFAKAKSLALEGPCTIFIDELDSLCPKRFIDKGSGQDNRSTSAVLSCMDELQDYSNIIIIGATNRPSAIDPALRRPGRFEREVLMNVPTRNQREEIFITLLDNIPKSKQINISKLAEMTNGFVGADLKSLCQEASYHAMKRNRIQSEVHEVAMEDFNFAMKLVVPSLQKGVEGIVDIKPVQWSEIGGLKKVKQQIKQAVEWPMLHPEAFERFGLPVSKGVMLYGPPGCCKTTLIRAASTATSTTFLCLNGAQLFSPFVGESERLISETFQKARALAPSILFLDELDSIVGKRSDNHNNVQDRLLSTLLNEMDGIGVKLDDKLSSSEQTKEVEGFTETTQTKEVQNEKQYVDNSRVLVVAATNRPDLIDAALLRPGRLDQIIYVPPPDQQARLEILRVICKKIPTNDVDFEWISEQTNFYTGADLNSLCREAAMCAMVENIESTEVNSKHFQEALKLVKASLSPSLIDKYKSLHSNTSKYSISA